MRAWRPDLLDMLGFWYNDLTRAQDGFKVALVELRDADIYYVYSLADFSYYCGYSLVAAGLGIDRNLVLDYGRTSAWRLNFKNQTYPSNPGVNPDLIRPKTKKFPLDPQFKPTVQCTVTSLGSSATLLTYCPFTVLGKWRSVIWIDNLLSWESSERTSSLGDH